MLAWFNCRDFSWAANDNLKIMNIKKWVLCRLLSIVYVGMCCLKPQSKFTLRKIGEHINAAYSKYYDKRCAVSNCIFVEALRLTPV